MEGSFKRLHGFPPVREGGARGTGCEVLPHAPLIQACGSDQRPALAAEALEADRFSAGHCGEPDMKVHIRMDFAEGLQVLV